MDQPIIEEDQGEKEKTVHREEPMETEVKEEAKESMEEEREKMKEEEVKLEDKEKNGFVEEVRLGEETLFSLPPEMQEQ